MKSVSLAQLKKIDLLEAAYLFAKKRKVRLYLVGGILRDFFLNRDKESLDLDFCLRRNAISFGQKLSRELKAGFVVLDKEHGACRLVKRVEDKVYTLDFTDFRDQTIEKDLLHRDFTINALALDLEKIFDKSAPSEMGSCIEGLDGLLIDPYGGKQDLKLKTIRAVNKKAFDEDPLRILRAYSFSAALGFKIEKETLQLIKSKVNKLSEVSCERIRDELFKILDRPNAFDYLVQMDEAKVIKTIIPEIEAMRGLKQGPYHHLDVWRHTLETIKQLEILSTELKNRKEIKNYLNEAISGERKRRALLKLGALFHDIGKPLALRHEGGKTKFHGHEKIGLEMTQEITKRLRLSNDELDALGKMVFWHLRPGYLADNEEITPRAKFRFFRDTAREAPSILLISIADQRSTRGPLTSKKSRIQHEEVALDLIKEYFLKKKEKPLPRLINGNDLVKHFKLVPSPLIGKVLAELDELQAIGKMKTRKDAFAAAKKFIQSHKPDLKKKEERG